MMVKLSMFIFADDPRDIFQGHLNLKFFSYYVLNTDQIDDSKLSESIAYQDTVYWLSKPAQKFYETLESYQHKSSGRKRKISLLKRNEGF